MPPRTSRQSVLHVSVPRVYEFGGKSGHPGLAALRPWDPVNFLDVHSALLWDSNVDSRAFKQFSVIRDVNTSKCYVLVHQKVMKQIPNAFTPPA